MMLQVPITNKLQNYTSAGRDQIKSFNGKCIESNVGRGSGWS